MNLAQNKIKEKMTIRAENILPFPLMLPVRPQTEDIEQIRKFKLIDTLAISKKNNIRFAVYENGEGEKAFAKRWGGKFYDTEYYWLKREIEIYQGLKDLRNYIGCGLEIRYPTIHTPALLGAVTGEKNILALLKFIDACPLESLSAEKMVEIVSEVIEYMRYIGEELVKFNKGILVKRSNIFFALKAPFVFAWAAFQRPAHAWELATAFFKFLRALPDLFALRGMVFVHRDLANHNIMVNGADVYVIDFGSSAMMNPVWELVGTVAGNWHIKDFTAKFLESYLMKEIFSDRRKSSLYKAFSMYAAAHRLATHSEDRLASNLDYFRYTLAL